MATPTQETDVREEIWKDWYNGTGPCEECSIRDETGCAQPYYGSGAIPAAVALVGDTPKERTKHPDRTWEDAPETHAERREIHHDAHAVLTDHTRLDEEFFEFLGKDFAFDSAAKKPMYSTNSLKCGKVDGPDYLNRNAREQCLINLKRELNAVDPAVIVPFGHHAIEAVYRLYNPDGPLYDPTVAALDVWELPNRVVVPSIHWSNSQMNAGDVEGISDVHEYRRVLADRIRQNV